MDSSITPATTQDPQPTTHNYHNNLPQHIYKKIGGWEAWLPCDVLPNAKIDCEGMTLIYGNQISATPWCSNVK